ncbi:MAG: (2Fe-2S)-binding protein [Chloroflexales bacterium]|nr:(2Fe-2S)-binding protein [Chloroflexales bacterium]
MKSYRLHINSTDYTVTVPADEPLLWVLRDDFGLTGTKPGCGVSDIHCCTVLVDGRPAHACEISVETTVGRDIRTIEGLSIRAENGSEQLHPVQQAFLNEDVSQCGWCLSGQVLTAVALLHAHPQPTDVQIEEAMSRVYCRCGTYLRIRRAVKRAATAVEGNAT